jgi:hypothetical protein
MASGLSNGRVPGVSSGSNSLSRGVLAGLACALQLALTAHAHAQQNRDLVARHQRCVIEAFARNADSASDFDPTLLDRSVDQCEKLLNVLKRSIIARTRDDVFAEQMLDKIRLASKRGTAVALMGYLDKSTVRSPAPARDAGLLDQPNSAPRPAAAGGAGGMLDEVDPAAAGVQTLRAK